MTNKSGLWISLGSGHNAEKIQNSIELNARFTKTVSVSKLRPKTLEVAVVSLTEDSIDFVGLSKLGREVATDEKTLSISQLIPLHNVTPKLLKQKLPKRYANQIRKKLLGPSRIPPAFLRELLSVISSLCPSAAEDISHLQALVLNDAKIEPLQFNGLRAFERDAIATALQISGGQQFRKKVLREAALSKTPEHAPFLQRLSGAGLREDAQVIHDASVFPGMDVVRRSQIGAVELASPNGDRLTIVHANRQPLETTLGVDLVYYHHRFDSFVLVQYKRMSRKRSEEPAYRPLLDKSHNKELLRMTNMLKTLRVKKSQNHSYESYRLSRSPFYFKVCEPVTKDALDEKMIAGMYIPLSLWKRILKDESSRGTRGAVALTWDNCVRRFSTTEFTSLVQHGWIGTAGGQSSHLSSIIEESLANKQMVIYAAVSGDKSKDNFLRDDRGRFASDDDTLATN